MIARRCAVVKRCEECTAEFRPFHTEQKACSRSCGAALRARKNPMGWTAAMRKAHAVRRERYKARVLAKVAGMTPLEIYRAGYVRGYTACQNRVRRGVRVA